MIFSVRISKASVLMRFLSLSLEDKFHSKPRIKTVQGGSKGLLQQLVKAVTPRAAASYLKKKGWAGEAAHFPIEKACL